MGPLLAAILVPATSLAYYPYASGATGYDVSYPDCSRSSPPPGSFGIVGVTHGRPFTVSGCVAAEYRWAAADATAPRLYFNTAYSGAYQKDITATCQASIPATLTDRAQRQGWATGCSEADYALSHSPGTAAMWWLDVETSNSWSTNNLLLNREAIQGAVSFIQQHVSVPVGIYSSGSWWTTITGAGDWNPTGASADWLAGTRASASTAAGFCGTGFSGVPVYLVQYSGTDQLGSFDADYAC